MRSDLVKILTVLLVINYQLLVTIALAAAPEDLKQSIEQKTQELEALAGQIKETQEKITNTQGQEKTLAKEIQRINYSISQLNLGIKSGEINIQKLGLEIESLQYDLEDIKTAVKNHREAITQLLRRLQQKDDENLLLVLLKNQSLAESISELQNINDLNKNLSMEVKNLQQLQKNLQSSLVETNRKKSQVELEKNNLQYRQSIVIDQKQNRQLLLAQTRNQEKLYQQQLGELEKRQGAISAEIEKIEDELRRTFDPSLLPVKRPGVLAAPINNPRVTQNFGESSWLYSGKGHNGVDFGAPIGTEIFAAADGAILAVGNNGRYQYGHHIMIQHNNNLVTLYAHLSKPIVQKGQMVKRGDLIGYSGNTGYAIGRGHLHFGLYWGPSVQFKNFPQCPCGLVPVGVTIDPLGYL